MVMRLMPSTLSRADRAPNMFAQRSGTSSDRLALRSLRNDVDCTNGRASPVLMHALLRAWPFALPPSGARVRWPESLGAAWEVQLEHTVVDTCEGRPEQPVELLFPNGCDGGPDLKSLILDLPAVNELQGVSGGRRRRYRHEQLAGTAVEQGDFERRAAIEQGSIKPTLDLTGPLRLNV